MNSRPSKEYWKWRIARYIASNSVERTVIKFSSRQFLRKERDWFPLSVDGLFENTTDCAIRSVRVIGGRIPSAVIVWLRKFTLVLSNSHFAGLMTSPWSTKRQKRVRRYRRCFSCDLFATRCHLCRRTHSPNRGRCHPSAGLRKPNACCKN